MPSPGWNIPFPLKNSVRKPITTPLPQALRAMGYGKEEMCIHGFSVYGLNPAQ